MDRRDYGRTDVRAQMMYDANKKSVGASYLLWFFLGGLGVHRFYLNQTGTGVAQLLLGLLGWIPLFLGWVVLGIWLFIDIFLIPQMAANENMKIADRFSTFL
jgi:TM2 domain-containing membrane protein YozV